MRIRIHNTGKNLNLESEIRVKHPGSYFREQSKKIGVKNTGNCMRDPVPYRPWIRDGKFGIRVIDTKSSTLILKITVEHSFTSKGFRIKIGLNTDPDLESFWIQEWMPLDLDSKHFHNSGWRHLCYVVNAVAYATLL
jgi:hypothetical protein